jgi:ribosomal protein S12 methylthiotransferase
MSARRRRPRRGRAEDAAMSASGGGSGAETEHSTQRAGTFAGESPSVALVSLGCPKNLVDSEGMAEILERMGFRAAGAMRGADVLLVNTCGFVRDAADESTTKIREALRLKREGAVRAVVAAGCLVQRMGAGIADEFPDLDAAVGTGSWHRVGEACRLALSGEARPFILDAPGADTLEPARSRSSYGHFGYLKVTEGCHRRCSYCLIPTLRGPLRSAPPEALVEEARSLARSGAVELMLVGEDIGSYGAEARGGWDLARLIAELDGVEGLRWIRLLYVHPASIDRRLVEAAESCEKVCSYIDVPVQHASDRVLSRMNRPTSRADLERALGLLKSSRKDFALRTTVMVGFPGETDDDFGELVSFVKEWEFDHLGAFCYSPEVGTKAAEYSDRVGAQRAEERMSEIMTIQSEISLKKNRAAVGGRAVVLVDEVGGDGVSVARTARQAPLIDGVTLVEGAAVPGRFLTVLLTGAEEYDLHARPCGEGLP